MRKKNPNWLNSGLWAQRVLLILCSFELPQTKPFVYADQFVGGKIGDFDGNFLVIRAGRLNPVPLDR